MRHAHWCVFMMLGLSIAQPSMSQVGIGTSSPNISSALEISHTSKGILIPRMTMNQRLAISAPAQGLMVYQTDGTNGFWYFTGLYWDLVGLIPSVRYNSYNRSGTGQTNHTLDSISLLPGHSAEIDYNFSINQNSYGSRTASFEITNLTGDYYISTSVQEVTEVYSSITSSASGSFIIKNLSNNLKTYKLIVKSSNTTLGASYSAEWKFIYRIF